MTVDIYDAERGDIPDIMTLIEASLLAKYHSEKVQSLMKRLYGKTSLGKTLDSDNRFLIVAIIDDEIVGVCQFGIPIMDDCDCEDLRMIQALFVHPEADHDEIASALIYDVEESINDEAGVQRLSVFVELQFMTLVKFYAGLGFYHDQVEDIGTEWYMEKDL